MKIFLIGNAVLHETTKRLLDAKWSIIEFDTLEQFLYHIDETVDEYVLWIHFDSEINETTFVGKKAPIILVSTTTGVTHVSPLVYNKYKQTDSMISLKGETSFLSEITSTAEHAWMLMLMLTSKVQHVIRDCQEKRYRRNLGYKPKQVSEMKIGIIGCGRLGSLSYQYAKSFGMDIQIFDIDSNKYELNSIQDNDIAPTLESLISTSEVILIHANSSVGTSAILGPEMFKLLKNGVFIVNTARANLVDGDSLILKLKAGELGGYAADVKFAEDIGGNPSWDHHLEILAKSGMNILVTPHIAGSASSAILKCEMFLVDKLIKALYKPLQFEG